MLFKFYTTNSNGTPAVYGKGTRRDSIAYREFLNNGQPDNTVKVCTIKDSGSHKVYNMAKDLRDCN